MRCKECKRLRKACGTCVSLVAESDRLYYAPQLEAPTPAMYQHARNKVGDRVEHYLLAEY